MLLVIVSDLIYCTRPTILTVTSDSGHNTLRRYLHIMRLSNNLTCRKCGTEEETSVHILGECEALTSLRHRYLSSFSLDPEDIRMLRMGAIWNIAKGTGLV